MQQKSKILSDNLIDSARGLTTAPGFLNRMTLPLPTTKPPVIFSPGRCGSNVYWSILQRTYYDLGGITYRHHDFTTNEGFEPISHSKFVYLLLRRNIHEYVLSKIVANRFGAMISEDKNYAEHVEAVSKWQSFVATQKEVRHHVDSLVYFLDYALLLLYAKKEMSLAYFEDLDLTQMIAPIKKNPYDKFRLVQNADEVFKWINDYENTTIVEQVFSKFEGIKVG